MSNFASMYKKAFKELLQQQGFALFKSMFFKEENDTACYIIYGRKKDFSQSQSVIELFVSVIPYCADLKAIEYDPKENADSVWPLYERLLPGKLDSKESLDFFQSRFDASSEEITRSSLDNLCSDMRGVLLPYVNRCADLEFFYGELLKPTTRHKENVNVFQTPFVHGLSIKLHKYENAIPYIEKKLTRHMSVIQRLKLDLDDLDKGTTNEVLLRKAKRDKSFIERFSNAKREMIAGSEMEVRVLERIKEALLATDYNYLDRHIGEIEISSRTYIQQIIKAK